MKLLIIEDEQPALRRITKLVQELDASIQVLGSADSISSAVKLVKDFPDAELILLDIELADGQSFEIFNQVEVHCPVIFTTAYDEFALKAFKVNSIDYLLKPIVPEELAGALEKFKKLKNNNSSINVHDLLKAFQPSTTAAYKERFLVKLGQKLLSIPLQEIAYFMAADKVVYLVTKTQKKYIVDYTLEEIVGLVNPKHFFHLNRQYLASLEAIESVSTYFNGKLKIYLIPPSSEEVLVSRDKAFDFKNWLNQ